MLFIFTFLAFLHVLVALPLPLVVTRYHTADTVTSTSTYITGTTTIWLPPVEIFISNGVTYTFTKFDGQWATTQATLATSTYAANTTPAAGQSANTQATEAPTTQTPIATQTPTTSDIAVTAGTPQTTQTASSSSSSSSAQGVTTLQPATTVSTSSTQQTDIVTQTPSSSVIFPQGSSTSSASSTQTTQTTSTTPATTPATTSTMSTSSTSTTSTSTTSTSTTSTSTTSTPTTSTPTTSTPMTPSTSTSTTSTSTTSTSTTSTSTTSTSTSSSTSVTPTTTFTPTTSTSTSTSTTTTSSTTSTIASGYISAPSAVVYSPYANDGTCKSYDVIKSDLTLVKSKGVNQIRIYGVDCLLTEAVLPLCVQIGLTVNQGFWITSAGAASIDSGVATVTAWAQTNGWSVFDYFTIGNEAVLEGYVSVSDLISKISSVKAILNNAGWTGHVTTSEPPATFIAHPELCTGSAIDFVGINPHSYFNTNLYASQSGEYITTQQKQVAGICSKNVVITETGYPHSGNVNGNNVPSPANQLVALQSIMQYTGGAVTILSTFDDYWKQPGPYGIEQSFGMISLVQ